MALQKRQLFSQAIIISIVTDTVIAILYTVVRTFHNIFSQWAWKRGVTLYCMFLSRFLLAGQKHACTVVSIL